jgi:hypothetical protein
VTWPPGSSSPSRRSGRPTSIPIGSAAALGTTVSFSAIALSTAAPVVAKSISRPPTRSDPSISALRRTNSSTTSRNAAPGKGTWSRVHCAIAWKPRTNSSFHRFSSSVARWATIAVGASMKNPL